MGLGREYIPLEGEVSTGEEKKGKKRRKKEKERSK